MSLEEKRQGDMAPERQYILAVLGSFPGEVPPQPGVIPLPSPPSHPDDPSISPPEPRPLWVPRVPAPGEKSPWERTPERRIGF